LFQTEDFSVFGNADNFSLGYAFGCHCCLGFDGEKRNECQQVFNRTEMSTDFHKPSVCAQIARNYIECNQGQVSRLLHTDSCAKFTEHGTSLIWNN